MYIGLHVKYPLFLSHLNEIWILLTYFSKILKHQISWKSVRWEPSCSMRTDGQTGRHNATNWRLSQFCLKNVMLKTECNVLFGCGGLEDFVRKSQTVVKQSTSRQPVTITNKQVPISNHDNLNCCNHPLLCKPTGRISYLLPGYRCASR